MKLVNAVFSDLPYARRAVRVIAGMLNPQTKADEVRVVRARLGLPAGMGVKLHLEERRADGAVERLLGGRDE